MNSDDKEITSSQEENVNKASEEPEYFFVSLADHENIEYLQVYLRDAFEDLTDMETLCKALKLTKTELDKAMEDALDN